MKYWLQIKAPAGNWHDSIGSGSLDNLISYAKADAARGATVRIIERDDRTLHTFLPTSHMKS